MVKGFSFQRDPAVASAMRYQERTSDPAWPQNGNKVLARATILPRRSRHGGHAGNPLFDDQKDARLRCGRFTVGSGRGRNG
jgi:hypothetical protein